LADPLNHAAWKARTAAVEQEIKRLEKALEGLKGEARRQAQERLKDARRRLPAHLPTISSVRNDASRRTAIHVLKRGDWQRKGVRVGPRVLGTFVSDATPELPAATENPRTALARWLTSPDHPL